MQVWVQVLSFHNGEYQCQKAGEDIRCPSSSREQIYPSSTFLFFQSLNKLNDAHCVGKRNLYSVSQFKCWFLLEKSSHMGQEIIFYQLPGNPLAQLSWHTELSIAYVKNVTNFKDYTCNIAQKNVDKIITVFKDIYTFYNIRELYLCITSYIYSAFF